VIAIPIPLSSYFLIFDVVYAAMPRSRADLSISVFAEMLPGSSPALRLQRFIYPVLLCLERHLRLAILERYLRLVILAQLACCPYRDCSINLILLSTSSFLGAMLPFRVDFSIVAFVEVSASRATFNRRQRGCSIHLILQSAKSFLGAMPPSWVDLSIVAFVEMFASPATFI
jgi:hypothetical protein